MATFVRSVYLDVCALSRPFDDQTQARIRLETEAVELILSHVRHQSLRLVISPVHALEIAAIDEIEERQTLEETINLLEQPFKFTLAQARQRAEQLMAIKIGLADAAHLAFAEQAQADFVSVDDRLLKQATRAHLRIWFGNPVEFCEKEKLR